MGAFVIIFIMDIVYVLGTGSTWNDNEIRFSLRSIVKNLRHFQNVWVVGEKPVWLQNIRYLSYPDISGIPSKNTFAKISAVCLEKDLSENFLLFNDDFFINSPQSALSFPYYYKGHLPIMISKSRLMAIESPRNTVDFLQKKNLTLLDYRVHCPFPINKKKFLEMPITSNEWGIVNTRAVYGNFYAVGGTLQKEILVSGGRSVTELSKFLKDKPFFSLLSIAGKNWVVRKFLSQHFDKKSKFEKDNFIFNK